MSVSLPVYLSDRGSLTVRITLGYQKAVMQAWQAQKYETANCNDSCRLAYKSSLESVKRDRQSSRERARSASEREKQEKQEKQASDFEKVYDS